ncbi:MAG: UpxY family transcription antiterminator [Flavobacterium sp.]|uniref:UpxY family transcription antiterminator n=1 Tax=Flavobacterium sp. TaxID=239 RepID=UPI0026063C27|nr:UpxY family transcription antiterminator [Flavobacterium sp.]MDD5152246.1 UpxY family transcription antiterminator [Flavobacterium sp.]
MILEKQNYRWYAIYTRANGEKKLFNNLQGKNIECYLPTRKVLKAWSDRKKWVDEPLFKCYIFVKVSYKEFFYVLNTSGAVCYVTFGGRAQSIPETQITNIRNFLSQCDHEVTLTYERIQKGVAVEVLHGSLKGIKGEVANVYGQMRLLIRLDSMNCGLYANISRDEVKLLDENIVCKSNVLV